MFFKILKIILWVVVIGIVLYVFVWVKWNCDRFKEGILIVIVLVGFYWSFFLG